MDMENNNGMAVMPVAPIGNNNNDFGGNGVWCVTNPTTPVTTA